MFCFRLRAPKTLHNCQYEIIMAAFHMHFLLKNIKSHKIFIIVIVQSENFRYVCKALSALAAVACVGLLHYKVRIDISYSSSAMSLKSPGTL